MKVIEACLVAAATATVGFLMMFLINDCRPLGEDPTKYPLQVLKYNFQYIISLLKTKGLFIS